MKEPHDNTLKWHWPMKELLRVNIPYFWGAAIGPWKSHMTTLPAVKSSLVTRIYSRKYNRCINTYVASCIGHRLLEHCCVTGLWAMHEITTERKKIVVNIQYNHTHMNLQILVPYKYWKWYNIIYHVPKVATACSKNGSTVLCRNWFIVGNSSCNMWVQVSNPCIRPHVKELIEHETADIDGHACCPLLLK